MANTDLLTPRKQAFSNWTLALILTGMTSVSVWQSFQDRLLTRDHVELSHADIDITMTCIYSCGACLYRLCAAGVLSFIKRYGWKRALIYICAMSILASVLVLFLDGSVAQIARLCREQLVKRLEKSVVDIEEMRGPIKVRHMTRGVPYSVEEHIKYHGEDVEFQCYRLDVFEKRVTPFPDHVVWRKNGHDIIVPSYRLHITWSFDDITASVDIESTEYYYMTSSSLKITFVEPDDFGNYSCHVKTVASAPIPPPMCPVICFLICLEPQPPQPPPLLRLSAGTQSTPPRRHPQRRETPMISNNDHDIVKMFSLVKMKELVRPVYAPPGGIVSFSATYDHFGDLEDVSFDYNIGGKPHHIICDEFLNGCWMTVLYYWTYWQKGGHFYDHLTRFNRIRMQNATTGTGWQCVCKQSYNVHEVWFYRRIFNMSSGREEIWAAKYPHSIKLAPRTPDLFFYNLTDNVDPVAKDPCWIDSRKQRNSGCQQDERLVDWVFWIFSTLERISCTVLLLIVLSLARLFVYLMRCKILVPIRNRILEGSWNICKACVKTKDTLGCINEDVCDENYDVFISYEVEHCIDVSYDLTCVIEALGYRVFHSDRNILGGKLRIEAVSDAICSSKRFVVLLTKEYIDNGFCNRLEFQMLLCKLSKKSFHYDRLLIINRDNCYIPEVLKNYCILEWERNADIESKLSILKHWLEGKVNDFNICTCA